MIHKTSARVNPQPAAVNESGEHFEVLVRTCELRTVENCRFATVAALANWLVSRAGQHHGRGGFSVEAGGERCFLVIRRAGHIWRWREIERVILPAFTRAKRLADLPLSRRRVDEF